MAPKLDFYIETIEEVQAEWEIQQAMFQEQRELLEELERLENNKHTRIYIPRNHPSAHRRIMSDYFDEPCVYTKKQFRRRFRMKRPLFLRIVEGLTNHMRYFTQRDNAANKLGLTSIMKCTAAMRMLAYGNAADACDEYINIGETTAKDSVRYFCEGIVELYGGEYLRSPNVADLERLLEVGENRGFPGMLGSIDCMHWEWKNCPKAWHGQFTNGHKGRATVVLEAVASQDLWIWHAFFGMPGVLNDLNVLDRSPLFDDIENGVAPTVNFNVNDNEYNVGYYLADGIYPKWPTFVKSIQMPQGNEAKLFSKMQESCRKDVERAFGVLQARFAIIHRPSLLWSLEKMGTIMKACIILHNMIVDNERHSYSRSWENIDFEPARSAGPSTSFTVQTEMHPRLGMHVQGRTRAGLREKELHIQLKNDLVKNIWARFGTTLD